MGDRKIVIPLILSSILVLLVLAVMTAPAVAAPNDNASDEGKENAKFIPDHAVKISQGVYSLGKAKDVTGKEVEGFMFIDYKKGFGKPDGTPGGGPKEKTSGGEKNTCFSLYAKGAKWKTTEDYMIGSGISATITAQSLNQWDSEVSFDIFGSKISGNPDGADSVSPDGDNEVMGENLGSTSTIAYAITWGNFGGPPGQRELVEWDVVFNTDYPFGNAGSTDENNLGDTLLMDYQNIATHEFGHSLGLSHPGDTCTEETMYRYASFGETKKRTIEAGDKTGLDNLYG